MSKGNLSNHLVDKPARSADSYCSLAGTLDVVFGEVDRWSTWPLFYIYFAVSACDKHSSCKGKGQDVWEAFRGVILIRRVLCSRQWLPHLRFSEKTPKARSWRYSCESSLWSKRLLVCCIIKLKWNTICQLYPCAPKCAQKKAFIRRSHHVTDEVI